MRILISFPFTTNRPWKKKIKIIKNFFNTLCALHFSAFKEAAESGWQKRRNKPINQIQVKGVSVFQFWLYFDYKSQNQIWQ